MRKVLALPFLTVLALLTAGPAAAAPTTVQFGSLPSKVTAGQTFPVQITLTQPAGEPDPVALTNAALALHAPSGFTITAVAAADGVTAPDLSGLPGADWTGAVNLANDSSTSFEVTLQAAAAQGAQSPLSLSLSQPAPVTDPPTDPPPADGDVVTASAEPIEIVGTGLAVTVTGAQVVFPTKATTVAVSVKNDSGFAWTQPVSVGLTLPNGVTLQGSPANLSGTTWSAPAPGPGGTSTLTLTLRVNDNTTEGQATVAATEANSAAASDTFAIAPKPELTIDPVSAVIVGSKTTVQVRIKNSASVGTGVIEVPIALSAGLSLGNPAPDPGGGSFVNNLWTIAVPAGGTRELVLTVHADFNPGGNDPTLLVAPRSLAIASQSLTIPVIDRQADPAVAFSGTKAALFPTEQTSVVRLSLANGSSTTHPANDVTLTLPPGLSIANAPAGLSGLTWRAPQLNAGATTSLDLIFRVAPGTPPGPLTVTAKPTGGAAATFTVADVLPVPTVAVVVPSTPLLQGGTTDVVVVTVTNLAPKETAPLALTLTIPAGLQVVSSSPALAGNTWTIGTLPAAPGFAYLTLKVAATASTNVVLGAQLGQYGGGRVDATIPVTAQAVAGPNPPNPAQPPTQALPKALPPNDVLSVIFAKPIRSKTSYTYRGEIKYRGLALSKQTCQRTRLLLTVLKLKGGKRPDKPADKVKLGLTYLSGHCLFGTKYKFFKKFKGKQYLLEFTVRTKIKLPTQFGTARPPSVTKQDFVTVGK